ncbi:ABC transporter ATP-binding protein [Histidinibacterium lentulum]|uniref:ABC transporter ATP-binding protein n=1 Tax=Histidinibacterium lentulum TaxID=2480588 RepID=A0A3N2R7L4_9RHOB|nr:ABC transporter ATP-binding protein [Histidinibacterium lentulum]ROU03427.1 ABC transporter ATP-binding protein [Histidinibacterium lentulum]
MLRISRITKTYEGAEIPALDDVSVDCADGSFTTLLGPSGCGKSTLLRCIAGLEAPDGGSVTLNDRPLVDADRGIVVPAHRRGIGMVFQSYAIWPHMTVAQNVGYPLKVRGDTDADIFGAVREVLEMVGLSGLERRSSSDLSGGQQQRVAIARAVVNRPSLLLLDEPMSNLDAHLRRQLGAQLRELQQRLKLTVVYVTHDRDEALTLSDRIVVMSHGRMADGGTPVGLYGRPRTDRGALSVGEANFLPAEIEAGDAVCRLFDPPLRCPAESAARETAVLLRPEWIDIWPGEPPADLSLPRARATIRSVVFRGMMTELALELPGAVTLLARIQRPLDLGPGDSVRLTIPPGLAVAVERSAASPTRGPEHAGTTEPLKRGPVAPRPKGRFATLFNRKTETLP